MSEPACFQDNLAVLVHRYPDLADRVRSCRLNPCYHIVRSGDGAVLQYRAPEETCAFPDARHSMLDQWQGKSRFRIERDQTYVIQGFGMGYHILDLLHRMTPRSSILVLDPDLTPFVLALRHLDLRALLSDARFEIHLGDDVAALRESLTDYARRNSMQHLVFIDTLPKKYREGGYGKAVKALFSQVFLYGRGSMQTAGRLEPVHARHAIRNLPDFLQSIDASSLRHVFQGWPCVVIGAGPSLEEHLPVLKTIRSHAVLVAADTALPVLIAAGLEPHFVCSVDPRLASVAHFKDIPALTECLLWADCGAHPEIIRQFSGRTIFGSSPANVRAYFPEFAPFTNALKGGINVAVHAVDLAGYLGASAIYLVGVDLAFHHGRRYAGGVRYEKGSQAHVHGYRFDTYPALRRSDAFDLLQVEDMDGNPIHSSPHFRAALHEIEALLRTLRVPCYNASRTGARIKGAEPIVLTKELVAGARPLPRHALRYLKADPSFRDAVETGLGRLMTDVAVLPGALAKGRRLVRRGQLMLREKRDPEHHPSMQALKREFNALLPGIEQVDFLKLLPYRVHAILESVSVRHVDGFAHHLDRIARYLAGLDDCFRDLLRASEAVLQSIRSGAGTT